jgi:hypothetical protein
LAKQGIAENDPGIAVGEKAAAGIIALHAANIRSPASSEPYKGDTKPGMWRPTKSYQSGPPASDASMAAPWLGTVTPFILKSGDQFRSPPPPELTGEEYTKAYNEVKDLGSFENSKRNEQQEELARFYSGSTPRMTQVTLREMADKYVDKLDDKARLLALGTMAMADVSITCWDNKKHHVFWRPVTAIQEGENDDNPNTIADPNWQPYLNTPAYPDYTSGANSVTAALTRTFSLFFEKDDMPFTVTSTTPKAAEVLKSKTKEYKKFSDMANDMVDTRILQGLHFRFADEAAREQGIKVAEWVFANVGQKK